MLNISKILLLFIAPEKGRMIKIIARGIPTIDNKSHTPRKISAYLLMLFKKP